MNRQGTDDLRSVDEALQAVLQRCAAARPERVGLESALGRAIAEDVLADLDLPPFDKALVDGYAIRAADLDGPSCAFRVVEEVLAGQTPRRSLGPKESALIMTGAPLPEGADAVLMLEHVRRDGDQMLPDASSIAPGRNRLTRGRELRKGDRVVARGETLTPARLGLLASVGHVQVAIHPPPRLAILPTGDELVEPGIVPGPGQIRNSNAAVLRGLAIESGAAVDVLPIAPDEPEVLRAAIVEGLRADVLLITGGVSAGARDLVPATLEALGVDRVFHKVRLKPGKPLWFGVGPRRDDRDDLERGQAPGREGNDSGDSIRKARSQSPLEIVPDDRPGTLVFGLPGNPVSGVVGFLLFVRPALEVLSGRPAGVDRLLDGRLTHPFTHAGDRPTYHPARWHPQPTGLAQVEPLDWAGSADLRTVALADGFVSFPAGDRRYEAGEIVRFLPLG